MIFEQNHQTSLTGFFSCNNSNFENVDFLVNNVKTNGFIDFYTDNHNINLNQCNFECISVEEDGTNAIGGIWIREANANKVSSDIHFNNCNFNHQSKDECIGVWDWNGTVKNIKINQCNIETTLACTAPHILTFDTANSSLEQCNIKINNTSSIQSVIHGYNQHQVFIKNSRIEVNTNIKTAISTNCLSIFENCNIDIPNGECSVAYGNGEVFYRNCTLNANICGCNMVHIYDSIINYNKQLNNYVFRSSCDIKNTNFKFVNFKENYIFAQFLENVSLFKLDNVKFEGDFTNVAWFLFNGIDSQTVAGIDISNSYVFADSYNVGTMQGIVYNNIFNREGHFQHITAIKKNNNFVVS